MELILETIQNAILIPSEAVVPELSGHKVYISKHGKATETPVTIGTRTDRNVEIVAGVNPGDTVITTGMLQLRNGMDVTLTKIQ